MNKLDRLMNQKTHQIGGKGTPRRKAIKRKHVESPRNLMIQLEKLLTKSQAMPLAGAKSVNFLSTNDESKTYHVFKRPQIKYVQSAHLMVIQNAKLDQETENINQTEETVEEISALPEAEETPKEAEEIPTEVEETPTEAMVRVPNRKERIIKTRILKLNPRMKLLTEDKMDPIGYMEQGDIRWNIEGPEVYQYTQNVYIVFGPVKLGMQEQKTESATNPATQDTINLDNFKNFNFADLDDDDDEEAPNLVAKDSSTPTETPTGLNEADIQVVMEQIGDCTRDMAITALQNAGGDLVSAVLELS